MSANIFDGFDAAELVIYIWNSEHRDMCPDCKKYNQLSVKALKKKWEEDWGDFDYLVKKLLQKDSQYINPSRYSTKTKGQLIDFIKKYNKKK